MVWKLEPSQRLAVFVIVAGRWAWTRDEDLRARGVSAEDLGRLEASGWVERWALPRCLSWTLTPWAVEQLRQEIVEKGRKRARGESRRRPGERGALRWDDVRADRPPDVLYPLAGMVRLEHPDWLVDPKPGPQYVTDLETGETSPDQSKAATLLGGYPIQVDRRAKKRVRAGGERAKRARRRRDR